MNEEKNVLNIPVSKLKPKEPPKKCQFYIVLGPHDRIFQSTDEKKFFPLNGNEDVNLIQYALSEEWKKKKKENIIVASEIIFLIPSLEYKESAADLMQKLNCRGKCQVIRPLKKEILKKEEIKEEPKKENIEEETKENKKEEISIQTPTEEVEEKPKEKEPTQEFKIRKEKTIVNQDNVFHKETESNEISKNEIADFMWGDAKKSKLEKSKASKSDKKIDLPVIIFILAAILLIGAVILLFILK